MIPVLQFDFQLLEKTLSSAIKNYTPLPHNIWSDFREFPPPPWGVKDLKYLAHISSFLKKESKTSEKNLLEKMLNTCFSGFKISFLEGVKEGGGKIPIFLDPLCDI